MCLRALFFWCCVQAQACTHAQIDSLPNLSLGDVDRLHSSVVLLARVLTSLPAAATAALAWYRARPGRVAPESSARSILDALLTDSEEEPPPTLPPAKRPRVAGEQGASPPRDFFLEALDLGDMVHSRAFASAPRRRLYLFASTATALLRCGGRAMAAVQGEVLRDTLAFLTWAARGIATLRDSGDAASAALVVATFSLLAAAVELDAARCARELAPVAPLLFGAIAGPLGDVRVCAAPHPPCLCEKGSAACCAWLRKPTLASLALHCACGLARQPRRGVSAQVLSSQLVAAAAGAAEVPDGGFLFAAWHLLCAAAAAEREDVRCTACEALHAVVECSVECLRKASGYVGPDDIRGGVVRVLK